MSRSRSAMLLLLGLASPGTAQSPSTADWSIPVGEFTIFGHTDYTPTIVLLPRVVYDTGRGMDSARVVDSVRARAKGSTGFAVGLSAWPPELYCSGPMSATIQQFPPRVVLERIQLAARCGVRLVVVPPRRLLTVDGRPDGTFSVESGKRAIDHYAAVLPADTIEKYRATILGLNLGDDYSCTQCWGGKAITQAEIAEWAEYARAKLPGLPLGVRVTPDWVASYPALAPLLDYTWAQYHGRKGDAKTFFDKAAAGAERLGLRVIMGVNVEHCYGAGTSPCNAADLARLGRMAVSHPASCAFINYRYDAATWQKAEMREAWEELLKLAKGREARECRRA
jgi:hypothetical protein